MDKDTQVAQALDEYIERSKREHDDMKKEIRELRRLNASLRQQLDEARAAASTSATLAPARSTGRIGQAILLPRELEEKGRALLDAAIFDRRHEVQHLIIVGAPIYHTDRSRRTALHYAAREGHVDVVSTLVASGAPVDAKDQYCIRPLHLAAYFGHRKVMATLIKGGATVDVRDNDGSTPLHVAARKGHPLCLEVLLISGANVDAVNEKRNTALHLAASRDHEQSVRLLLRAGADPSIRNDEGKTARDKASTPDMTAILS